MAHATTSPVTAKSARRTDSPFRKIRAGKNPTVNLKGETSQIHRAEHAWCSVARSALPDTHSGAVSSPCVPMATGPSAPELIVANQPDDYLAGRALFSEYASQLGVDLCFQ